MPLLTLAMQPRPGMLRTVLLWLSATVLLAGCAIGQKTNQLNEVEYEDNLSKAKRDLSLGNLVTARDRSA